MSQGCRSLPVWAKHRFPARQLARLPRRSGHSFMDMAQAVILVGGAGTRLGDLGARTPNPLLPVGDRPFLSSLIREIARFGIRRFLLIAGHKGESVAAFVAERPGLTDLAIDI